MPKTILIGLGEIGKPLFNIISKSENNETIGIDIQPVDVAEPVGIMHICVPFQQGQNFTEIVVNYAKKYRPEYIVVNSTVTPGTSELIESMTSIPTVYSPVRGKHTKMEADLLHYRKFLAGTNPQAVKVVEAHFNRAGMKTTVISIPRSLELSKLLETTYFGLLIAWAQEIERMGKQIGSEYSEIVPFFEEISYLPPYIFQPGFIGGHCVMPNIKLLEACFTSEFLDVIKHSNEKKAAELTGNQDKLNERISPIKINQP